MEMPVMKIGNIYRAPSEISSAGRVADEGGGGEMKARFVTGGRK